MLPPDAIDADLLYEINTQQAVAILGQGRYIEADALYAEMGRLEDEEIKLLREKLFYESRVLHCAATLQDTLFSLKLWCWKKCFCRTTIIWMKTKALTHKKYMFTANLLCFFTTVPSLVAAAWSMVLLDSFGKIMVTRWGRVSIRLKLMTILRGIMMIWMRMSGSSITQNSLRLQKSTFLSTLVAGLKYFSDIERMNAVIKGGFPDEVPDRFSIMQSCPSAYSAYRNGYS